MGSLTDVFILPLFTKPEPDINDYVTPRQRLRSVLQRSVSAYKYKSYRESHGRDMMVHEIIDAIDATERKVAEFMAGLGDDSDLLPEPIASLRVRYSDLPDPLVIPEDLLRELS